MLLSDGVVRLRDWSEADLACVQEASGDLRIVESTTVPAAYSEQAGRAYVARQLQRERDGVGHSLVIEAGGVARGQIYIGRPEPDLVRLGYWVAPSARGQGLARRAVALATAWALNQVDRVEAHVEPDNVASQRTLEHAGFTREQLLEDRIELRGRRADALVYVKAP